MLSEFEFFHGAALCRLIQNKKVLSIIPYESPSNSSYVVNELVGIYIKYSSKRLSPWRFTFLKEHQDEILEMRELLGEVFILLVCGKDGIACLNFNELKNILDHDHGEAEWISASRGYRQKYTVKGSDGALRLKINVSDFSDIISASK